MASSLDYDEKINKLFEEGKKLGASFPNLKLSQSVQETGNKQASNAISTKIDVMALEDELNHQAKETNRLQQELNSARDNIQRTGQAISNSLHTSVYGNNEPLHQSNTLFQPIQHNSFGNSNANNNHNVMNPSVMPAFQPNEITVLTNTKIHLENALEDSQTQVEHLTNKLEKMRKSMEDQKDRFRQAVEELQNKLHETVAGRKKLLELRQQDMNQQEETIHRLQTTLKELAASNQMQEQSLLDAHERMEIMENRNQTNERCMTQIRSIISSMSTNEVPGNKTTSFSTPDHISDLVPDLLVDNLSTYLSNSRNEADSLRSKLLQLEAELNATKQAHEADRLLASSDASEMASNLKAEHRREIEEERIRRKEAEDSLTLVTNELKELQADNTTQVRLVAQSRDQINELNRQLDDLRQHHCNEKGDFQSKIVCLEYDSKLASDKSERLLEENQAYKLNITELNRQLQQMTSELNSERSSRCDLSMKEKELSKDLRDTRSQIESKNNEISRLREVTAQLRGELSTKIAREINEAENVQRIKSDEKISTIVEENIGLREDLSRTKASFEAAERQLRDVNTERTEAMQMLKEKDKQVDRLTSQLSLSDRKLIEAIESRKSSDEKFRTLQKDYDETNKAAKQSQSDIERLRAVTDDKERISLQLRHQLENKTEQAKSSEKKSEDMMRENNFFKTQAKEQSDVIDGLKEELKSKSEMMMEYEKRMKDVVAEKEKIVKDVHAIEKQISSLIESKQDVEDELKETRSQLSRLIHERDMLSKERRSTEENYKFEVEQLWKELQDKKMDLKMFQEAVQSVKKIDGKAAVLACNMQKEVSDKRGVIDSLQTELSNLYDKLEIEERESKYLKKENSKLQKEMNEWKENYKKTEQELRSKIKSEKNYRINAERLEVALEKAAERNTAAQLVINRQESELSKSHIRRNLDLMDKRRIPSVPPGASEDRMFVNPPTNNFGRPSVVPSNQVVLQSILARALATMTSTQPQQDDFTFKSKPASADGRDSKLHPNLSSEEIFQILTEVREQLAQTNNNHQKSSGGGKGRSNRRKPKGKSRKDYFGSESYELPVVFLHSDNTSASSDVSSTVIEHSSLEQSRDFVMTSSPCKKQSDDVTFLNPPSPVSMLLFGGGDTVVDATSSFSPIKKKKSSKPVKRHEINEKETREKFVNDAISDNAEELCRQLQDRLEGLTKIGGKLEKQNKVAAKLMRKQDAKLKRVREANKVLR